MLLSSSPQGTKNAPPPRPHKRPRLTGPEDSHDSADVKSKKADKTAKPADDVKTSKKSAQLDEFIKVMQPRAKKGRAWSNGEDAQPQPVAAPQQDVAMVDEEEDDEVPEGVSDLEWMRRRMKKTVLDDAIDRVFEQSDDEDTKQVCEPICLSQLC